MRLFVLPTNYVLSRRSSYENAKKAKDRALSGRVVRAGGNPGHRLDIAAEKTEKAGLEAVSIASSAQRRHSNREQAGAAFG